MKHHEDWSAEQTDEFFTHMLMVVGPPRYGYAGTKHVNLYWDAATARNGGRWPSYNEYTNWFESLSSRA